MKPLGFIIITYNRPCDMLELAMNLAQLDAAQDLLQEIIIVNNASTEDYSALQDFIQTSPLPFRYVDAPENLGVARGRNYALELSSAPILILLDDDALLQNTDALSNLIEEFEQPFHTRPKALISFKVLYFDTLQMQVNAFPHKNFKANRDKHRFDTYYYAGGAHAIKREVLEQLGSYPQDFFYGMEEYDLSYRILNAGYSITYSDRMVMLHKESPLGRQPREEKLRMMWVNKSKVAYRYLPLRYFYSTAIMWSLEYLKKTRFNLRGWMKGWKEVTRISKTDKRTPVTSATMTYLRNVNARLWY